MVEACRCPLCGAAVENDKTVKIYNGATVVIVDGKVLKFTRSEAAIFNALYQAVPRTLTCDQIMDALMLSRRYAGDEPNMAGLSVFVTYINRKLKSTRMRVTSGYASGYKLELNYKKPVKAKGRG